MSSGNWKVGTEKNPEMFSNNNENMDRERFNNEMSRLNYIQTVRFIDLPPVHYSVKYDSKNNAHVFWSAVNYVKNVLKEEPVIDIGDAVISDFVQAADPEDLPVGVVF